MMTMTNSTNIDSLFSPYKLPNLNWVRLPSVSISDEEKLNVGLDKNCSNFEFLKRKTELGFKKKKEMGILIDGKDQDYQDKINEELELVSELGFTDYYLLVWRTVEKAREITNYIDPARGSCGGSCVFFMIRVTALDPVKHKLFLSRFISRVRANKKEIDGVIHIQGDLAPDVDLNFAKDVRHQIIEWLEKEYSGKMAQISTYSCFTPKILLKEVYKGMTDEGTETQAQVLAGYVESKFGKLNSLKQTYELSEEFKEWADENPDQYETALALEGIPKNISSHASGFVISYHDLNKTCPLTLNKNNELTCVYEMNDVAKISLKLDLLGLTTNKIISETIELIKERQGIDIDYELLDLDNDEKIYRHLQGHYAGTGIYQIEKGCAFNVTKAVKPKNISGLSDVNALARPGALDYLNDYVKNDNSCKHEIFEDILKDTHYQPLYQEQMIQMAVALGFTPEDGEVIRRAAAKKSSEKMAEWEEKVKQKCVENNHGVEVAEYYWKLLQESANYSFNRSHSLGVSYVGALTIYLKYNYPTEFFTAYLNNCNEFPDPTERITSANNELSQFGIKMLGPVLGVSTNKHKPEDKGIRYGLQFVKGVSDQSLDDLAKLSTKGLTKFEIFKMLDEFKIKLNVICPLIQAGAMDDLKGDRSFIVYECQTWKNLTEREKTKALELEKQHKSDLIECIRYMRDKEIIKPSRVETLRKKIAPYYDILKINKKYSDIANWFYEYKILGFSYSESSLSKIHSERRRSGKNNDFTYIKPLKELSSNNTNLSQKEVSTVGIVKEVQKRVSPNSGNTYLRFLLEDGQARVDMILMDGKQGRLQECIDEQGRLPEDDDLVEVRGSKTEDGSMFFVNSIAIQTAKIFTKLHELKTYQEKSTKK